MVTRGYIGISDVDGDEVKLWLSKPRPTDPTEMVRFKYKGVPQMKAATWTESEHPKPDDAIEAERVDTWGGNFVSSEPHLAGSAEPRRGSGDAKGSK